MLGGWTSSGTRIGNTHHHHRGEKSYRSCLPQNDAKETTEERCRPQKKIINTAQTTTTSTTTTTKKKKKIASLLTLQCGYFFAKRMATWEAIKPAPPVINTFFGSYGISHSLFFMTMFLPSLKRMDLSFKFAVDWPFFFESSVFFVWRKAESVSLEKQRKRLPPFILKTRFARPRDAQIASSIIRF